MCSDGDSVGSADEALEVVERGYSLIDKVRALTPEREAEKAPFEPDRLTGDGRVAYVSKATKRGKTFCGRLAGVGE